MKVQLKTFSGRGRKVAPWVAATHAEHLDEFDRLKKTGVKFSPQLLTLLARKIIENTPGEFNRNYKDPFDGKLIIDKINNCWTQHFQEKHNIVLRRQTGKLLCSPEKQYEIKSQVLYHLGVLKKKFNSGELDENLAENMDETHFVNQYGQWMDSGFQGRREREVC